MGSVQEQIAPIDTGTPPRMMHVLARLPDGSTDYTKYVCGKRRTITGPPKRGTLDMVDCVVCHELGPLVWWKKGRP